VVKGLQEPVVSRAEGLEFDSAQRVGDGLEAIAQAVGELVGRVDSPLVAGAVVVVLFLDSVGGDVPHGGVLGQSLQLGLFLLSLG